jgi:signal transduction histidine kinase
MIFRAVQELLGNAARHSQASLIKVQVDLGNDLIRVSVDDNGKGFDPETLKESSNLGLKLIRERAEMLGGSFEIDSVSGSGARISFTVQARN